MKRDDHTHFAPARRESAEEVEREFQHVDGYACSQYFDFFPLPLAVLNPARQIVFANKPFQELTRSGDGHSFLGKRPGEIVGCVHASTEPGGCGTSVNCRECGAVLAVLETMATGKPCVRDCQILQNVDGHTGALDLRVHAAPWQHGEDRFCVVTMMDISAEKEREVMERVFYHDLLNSAGSAYSLVSTLHDECPQELSESLDLVGTALSRLVDQIQSQRTLQQVERGEYVVSRITLQALEVLETVVEEYLSLPLAKGRRLVVDPASKNGHVKADHALLRRVLVNMVKNALEASAAGDTVTAAATVDGGTIRLSVHNPQCMAESVQLQLFKRSFSTKGPGRGLGTYSIKLLGEDHLGGRVGFESTEAGGTTFWIDLKVAGRDGPQ